MIFCLSSGSSNIYFISTSQGTSIEDFPTNFSNLFEKSSFIRHNEPAVLTPRSRFISVLSLNNM